VSTWSIWHLVLLTFTPSLPRSIKLENFVVQFQSPVGPILKLIDFGLCVFETPECTSTPVGSHDYAAPECHRIAQDRTRQPGATYDAFKADSWSLGVVLYEMHQWRYPFVRNARLRAIRDSEPQPAVEFTGAPISAECKAVVDGLLHECPLSRLSPGQALASPWLRVQIVQGASK
jgi:serine/threonine-protein kinase SRK2